MSAVLQIRLFEIRYRLRIHHSSAQSKQNNWHYCSRLKILVFRVSTPLNSMLNLFLKRLLHTYLFTKCLPEEIKIVHKKVFFMGMLSKNLNCNLWWMLFILLENLISFFYFVFVFTHNTCSLLQVLCSLEQIPSQYFGHRKNVGVKPKAYTISLAMFFITPILSLWFYSDSFWYLRCYNFHHFTLARVKVGVIGPSQPLLAHCALGCSSQYLWLPPHASYY